MQQTVLHYASKRDLQAHALSGEITLLHFRVYGRSKPIHAVSEGSMTLAADKRPEPNQLIRLRQNALQHPTRQRYEVDMLLSMLADYRLVAN